MAVNPENFFNGDGSTTLFPFTFEYLEESDVKVSVDGTVKTQDTDYTFANATTISFNTAPASGSDNIRIYRDTNVDELKSTFFAGSAIRASDLNDNLTQNNYAVQEIKAYTWDNETDTIHSNETWVSSDTQIATTAAMDQRFQDEAAETITSAETWPDNDDTIATTAAIDNRIDTAITNDIGTDGTGITVTDDGDGTITLGLADNTIDFSKIKDADIITDTEQDAGSPSPTNDNLFSALGAARRFDTIVNQTEQSTSVDWEVGKTWLQNDAEKTVRIWDGSAWVAVASGGAFTTLPKVVYVDSVNGDDSLEGHRISNPKRTIKAAIQQINAETDAVGDGSVVIVAPGVYQEAAPIDIQKKNVSIIGQALRSCIVHPTPATEENTLFRLNSGSYVANLTLTGVKASGTRGGNSLDTDSTYGLPTNQGWNFAFYPNATIVKSPYIANCTNFSDSEIDNSDLNAFNPRGGLGGDTDSAPTGGGILVDGAAVSSSSPLRSMVCDSYTHVGLDGPGIFVTNNGYCQATSSYAFFTHYHIKALNGGQANLAASTSDFGRYALIAQGRSSSAIFTATTTATASSGATTFTIGAPSAGGSWFGSATRPQSNMVVDIGGNTYSIIGATANGSGWDVEISRPDPDNLSTNLGLNGAVSSGSSVSFFLRSMIASSGHTMEYVGSGTNYSALPENGGVPIESNEIIELSNGKVWAATTNHQGKFTVGPTFNVDQVTGYVNIANGAIGIEKLIENLDLNSYTLSDSTGDVTIDDTLDMNTNRIVNVVDPTSAQDAATKNYVDTSSANTNYVAVSGDSMTGDLNMNSNNITNAAGLTMTGNITMNAQSDVRFADADSSNYVALQAPATIGTNYTLTLPTSTGNAGEALITDASGNLSWSSSVATIVDQIIEGDTKVEAVDTGSNGEIQFTTDGTRAMTIDSSQRLGVGTSSPDSKLHILDSNPRLKLQSSGTNTTAEYFMLARNGSNVAYGVNIKATGEALTFGTGGNPGNSYVPTEKLRIDSSGRLGIGTTSPGDSHASADDLAIGDYSSSGVGISINTTTSGSGNIYFGDSSGSNRRGRIEYDHTNDAFRLYTADSERLRIDSSGHVGIGTTSPSRSLTVASSIGATNILGVFDNSATTATNCLIAFSDPTSTQGQFSTRLGSVGDGLAFYTNGANERLRIDSSGKVGIGTTSPNSPLDVLGSNRSIQFGSTARKLYGWSDSGGVSLLTGDSQSGTGIYFDESGHTLRFATGATYTERLRIDSSGRLGVGTSSPGDKIDVRNDGACYINIQRTTSGSEGRIILGANNGYNNIVSRDGASGAMPLRFDIGTTERMRIDSSGRLGVGTSSPDRKLHVAGDWIRVDDGYGLDTSGGTEKVKLDNGYIALTTSSAERVRLDSSGRLLVGTSTAGTTGSGQNSKLTVQGYVGGGGTTGAGYVNIARGQSATTPLTSTSHMGGLYFTDSAGATFSGIECYADGDTGSGDYPGRLAFSTTADGASSPTERMRIASTGETELYTDHAFNLRTNRTSGLTAALNVYKGASSVTTGTLVCQIRADGDLLNTNGAYDALSDAKLKENIVDANSQWDDIKAVRIRNWNFKEETGYGTHTQIGTIAQELELVSPGLVRDTPDTDEDGNDLGTTTKSVKNSILYMKAVKALQEAMERIEQLEAKVAALEAN